jgi:protein-S-isoprenylcysteine O-methyltransferase Ste14
MPEARVDYPSLVMAVVLTANMVVAFWDPYGVSIPGEIGQSVFILGALLCAWVAIHLKRGLLGETDPKLDHLVTSGPYRFSRHPLYVGFVTLMLGIDLMLGSPVALAFTILLSLPSTICRAIVEDEKLRKRFGKEWEDYASGVGFMMPYVGRWHSK